MKISVFIIFLGFTSSLMAKNNTTFCSNSRANITLFYYWEQNYPAKIVWEIDGKYYEKPKLYIKIIGSRKNLEKWESVEIGQVTFYRVKLEILIKATHETHADWFICEEIKVK